MKFNMGCGARQLPGFVNVDAQAACSPDEIVDLERTPWPWPSDVAHEIHFIHSLEHMGADPKVFLAIMAETWRIAADGCLVQINVPHPRHDNFLGDPTHVRPITPQMLQLFDREACDVAQAAGGANTPFAHYLGIDLRLIQTTTAIDEPYFSEFQRGDLTREALDRLIASQFNVVRELKMTLRAVKAAG